MKPFRFTKEEATQMFRYVSKVKIHFNPFDIRSVSAGDVMNRLQAPRFRKANPRFEFDIQMHNRATAPLVEFTFVDETQYKIQPSNTMIAKDILFQVNLKAQAIDFHWDMEGKDIDNL